MKKFSLITLLISITSFTTQDNYNVDGLTVIFRKISEDYVRPGNMQLRDPIAPFSTTMFSFRSSDVGFEANEGMKFVKLKLTLKNVGKKDCIFDFKDVYISSEKDSLYRFVDLQDYFAGTKTKIKPNKEIKRIVFFEFPDKEKPKELFIVDKRYKIEENYN